MLGACPKLVDSVKKGRWKDKRWDFGDYRAGYGEGFMVESGDSKPVAAGEALAEDIEA